MASCLMSWVKLAIGIFFYFFLNNALCTDCFFHPNVKAILKLPKHHNYCSDSVSAKLGDNAGFFLLFHFLQCMNKREDQTKS